MGTGALYAVLREPGCGPKYVSDLEEDSFGSDSTEVATPVSPTFPASTYDIDFHIGQVGHISNTNLDSVVVEMDGITQKVGVKTYGGQ